MPFESDLKGLEKAIEDLKKAWANAQKDRVIIAGTEGNRAAKPAKYDDKIRAIAAAIDKVLADKEDMIAGARTREEQRKIEDLFRDIQGLGVIAKTDSASLSLKVFNRVRDAIDLIKTNYVVIQELRKAA